MGFRGFLDRLFRRSDGGAAEGMRYIPLAEASGDVSGAVVIHPKDARRQLVGAGNEIRGLKARGALSNQEIFGLERTIQQIPHLKTALEDGGLIQVVGRSKMIAELNSGALLPIRAEGGSFAGTAPPRTSPIAGQIRLVRSASAAVAAPVMVWQAANVVVGTVHLQDIAKRLETLQGGIDRIAAGIQAQTLGRAISASKLVDAVDHQYRATGTFSDDMLLRLALADATIRATYEEASVLLARFREMAQNALEKRGKTGTEEGLRLLKEEAPDALTAARLVVGLSRSRVRAGQLWLLHDAERCPSYLPHRMEWIKAEMQESAERTQDLEVFQEVTNHAVECAQEMNWFRRRVMNRSLAKESKNRAEALRKEIQDLEPLNMPSGDEKVLLLWQGRLGLEGIHLASEGPERLNGAA